MGHFVRLIEICAHKIRDIFNSGYFISRVLIGLCSLSDHALHHMTSVD